jgi:hypothetical protein
MRSARYLFLALFVLVLTTPKPVWSAKESPGPAGEKVASEKGAPTGGASVGGRGEGFEPEAEATKGEEIPATFGPIVTDTAIPVEKGKFVVQPTFGYSFVNSIFNENWKRASAGGNFQSFSMDWKLTYGLMENMEVFVVIPYAHNWAKKVTEPGPNGETSGSSGGLADINLTLKYRLVEETDCLPTVTALFATDFPTGKFKNLNPTALNTDVLGGGAYLFTPGFNVSKYIKPFIVYGNLWYSMQTSYTDDGGKAYPGDFVTVNLAAEYPITKKWVALLELTSSWGGGRLFGPKTNLPQESLVSIIPGIEYMATDKFSVALGLNIDLVGKNTDAAITPLLSMIYAF